MEGMKCAGELRKNIESERIEEWRRGGGVRLNKKRADSV